MTSRAALKASDADREQAAEHLRQAAAEGRLQPDELDDRLGIALSARSYGELDAIVSDLPAPAGGRGRRWREPARMRLAIAVGVAVSLALVLIAVAAFALGGRSHPDHHSLVEVRGGAPLVWLLWIAIGWRLIAHRRGRAR